MVQAWTIGGKYQKKTESLAPGPGQYSNKNTDTVKLKSPEWKIGTSQRDSFRPRAFSPGPGMYTAIDNGLSAPKYHFGTKSVTDFNKFKKNIPGPGQYNPETNAFSKIGFSFTSRHNPSNKDLMGKPGPGTYDARTTLSQTLGKIGSSQKGEPLVSKMVLNNPGPGQYNNEAINPNSYKQCKYFLIFLLLIF